MAYERDHPSPEMLIERYSHIYGIIYNTSPRVRYLGNQWFLVNAEIVHYRIMLEQCDQLRALAKHKQLRTNNKSIVNRLIDKLRGLS